MLERIGRYAGNHSREQYLCEVRILLALAYYAEDKKEKAFEQLKMVINMVSCNGYFRLVADEGEAIYRLLLEYKKYILDKEQSEETDMSGLNMLIAMSRDMAVMYSRYLRPHARDYQKLTRAEIGVLRLMDDGLSNSQIADYLNVTLNTVKFHSKNIYKKLGVKNRYMAVKIAKEEGQI